MHCWPLLQRGGNGRLEARGRMMTQLTMTIDNFQIVCLWVQSAEESVDDRPMHELAVLAVAILPSTDSTEGLASVSVILQCV